MNNSDITRTGYNNYRELQEANNSLFAPPSNNRFAQTQNRFSPQSQQPELTDDEKGMLLLLNAMTKTKTVADSDVFTEGYVYDPRLESARGKGAWGDSMFDEDILYNSDIDNWEDKRAENQPWIAKASAGLLKGGILAGTTFLSGTVGLVDGVVEAFATGDFSKVWDNYTTRALRQFEEGAEELLPNYYSSEELENPWYKNILSTNFLFDTVVKNAGFAVGALYSGGLYAKGAGGIMNLAQKAINAGKLQKGFTITQEAVQMGDAALRNSQLTRQTKALTGAVFGAVAEGSIEAYHGAEDFVKGKTQEIEQRYLEDYKAAELEYQATRGRDFVAQVQPDGTLSYVDPAYEKFKEKVRQLDAAKEASLKSIEEQRSKVGNNILAVQLPLLTTTDFLTFGKLYAGGWKAGREVTRAETRATKQALKAAKEKLEKGDPAEMQRLNDIIKRAKKTGWQGLTAEEKLLIEEVAPHTLNKALGVTKAAIAPIMREGIIEEMGQRAIQEGSKMYFEDKVDAVYDSYLGLRGIDETKSWLKAHIDGILKTYSDIDAYEEGFVGGLMGALGIPTFSRSANKSDQTWLGRNMPIGLTGGSVVEVRDYLKKRNLQDDSAAALTSLLRSDKTITNFNRAVAQYNLDNDKKYYILHDDKKSYKDADTAGLFIDYMAFKKAGRLDLLTKAVEYLSADENLDTESIQELIEKTEAKTIAGKTLSQLEQELEVANSNYIDDDNYDNQVAKEQLEHQIALLKSRQISPFTNKDGSPMTDAQVREEIKHRAKKISELNSFIGKTMNLIDSQTGQELTDEQLTTLTWYRTMMYDWKNRADQIQETLLHAIDSTSSDNNTIVNFLEQMQEFLPDDTVINNVTDPEGQATLGGTISNRRKFNTALQDIRQVLNRKNGILLAQALNNPKESDNNATAGENLANALMEFINSNTELIPEDKNELKKDIEDLKRIGKSYNRYNELVKEFMDNPDSITEMHKDAVRQAARTAQIIEQDQALRGLDFNGTLKDLYESIIENEDKLEEIPNWKSKLTPEQKAKLQQLEQLQALSGGIAELNTEIDQDNALEILLDDNAVQLGEQLIVLNGEQIRLNIGEDTAEQLGVNPDQLDAKAKEVLHWKDIAEETGGERETKNEDVPEYVETPDSSPEPAVVPKGEEKPKNTVVKSKEISLSDMSKNGEEDTEVVIGGVNPTVKTLNAEKENLEKAQIGSGNSSLYHTQQSQYEFNFGKNPIEIKPYVGKGTPYEAQHEAIHNFLYKNGNPITAILEKYSEGELPTQLYVGYSSELNKEAGEEVPVLFVKIEGTFIPVGTLLCETERKAKLDKHKWQEDIITREGKPYKRESVGNDYEILISEEGTATGGNTYVTLKIKDWHSGVLPFVQNSKPLSEVFTKDEAHRIYIVTKIQGDEAILLNYEGSKLTIPKKHKNSSEVKVGQIYVEYPNKGGNKPIFIPVRSRSLESFDPENKYRKEVIYILSHLITGIIDNKEGEEVTAENSDKLPFNKIKVSQLSDGTISIKVTFHQITPTAKAKHSLFQRVYIIKDLDEDGKKRAPWKIGEELYDKISESTLGGQKPTATINIDKNTKQMQVLGVDNPFELLESNLQFNQLYNPYISFEAPDTSDPSKKKRSLEQGRGTIRRHKLGQGNDRINQDEGNMQRSKRRRMTTFKNEKKAAFNSNQYKQHLRELSRMFPSLNIQEKVQLLDSLAGILENSENPSDTLGLFLNGVIYLSTQKSYSGILYHESFHMVFDSLLSNEQKAQLFEEARTLYNTNDEIELEERIAERFRFYMLGLTGSGITGFIKRMFMHLKHLINNISLNKSYTEQLFWQMYKGRYESQNPYSLKKQNSENSNTSQLEHSIKLNEYYTEQFDYNNLTEDQLEILQGKQISEIEYRMLPSRTQQRLLEC